MPRRVRQSVFLAIVLQHLALAHVPCVEVSATVVECHNFTRVAGDSRLLDDTLANVAADATSARDDKSTSNVPLKDLRRRAWTGLDLNEPAVVEHEQDRGSSFPLTGSIPLSNAIGETEASVPHDDGTQRVGVGTSERVVLRVTPPRKRPPKPLTEEQKRIKRERSALYRSFAHKRPKPAGPMTWEEHKLKQKKKGREIIDMTLRQYQGSLGPSWTAGKAAVFRNALQAEGIPTGTNRELARRVRWMEVGRFEAKGIDPAPVSEEGRVAREQTRLMKNITPTARSIPDYAQRETYVLNAFAAQGLAPPDNLRTKLLRMSQQAVLDGLRLKPNKGQTSRRNRNQEREEILLTSSNHADTSDDDEPSSTHDLLPFNVRSERHCRQHRADSEEGTLVRRAGGLDFDLNEVGSGGEAEPSYEVSHQSFPLPDLGSNGQSGTPTEPARSPRMADDSVRDRSAERSPIVKKKAGRPRGYIVSEITKERTRRTKLINYERRTAQGLTEKSLVLLGEGSKTQTNRVHQREARLRKQLTGVALDEPTSPKSRLSFVAYGLPLQEDDTMKSMYEKVCDVFGEKGWPRPTWEEASKKIYQSHFSSTRSKGMHAAASLESNNVPRLVHDPTHSHPYLQPWQQTPAFAVPVPFIYPEQEHQQLIPTHNPYTFPEEPRTHHSYPPE